MSRLHTSFPRLLAMLAVGLGALVCAALVAPQTTYAQTGTYGIVQDAGTQNQVDAVYIPAFSSADVNLIQGATFTILMPEGTLTTPTIPNDATAGSFNNVLGNWQVNKITESHTGSDGDYSDFDVYLVTLTDTPQTATTAGQPLILFTFVLPAGCAGGSIQILDNDSAIHGNVESNTGANVNNTMTGSVDGNSPVELYGGNNATDALIICSTLPVTLSWFLAEANDDGTVDIRWQTATETNSAGFHLLAVTEDGAEQLNSELIQSQVIDSAEPTDYEYTATTDADTFLIQQVDLDGAVDEHGPFTLGIPYGIYIEAAAETDHRIWLPFVIDR